MSLTPTGTPKSGGRCAVGIARQRAASSEPLEAASSAQALEAARAVEAASAPRGNGRAGRSERALGEARRPPRRSLARSSAPSPLPLPPPAPPPASPRRRCAGSRCSGRGCRRGPGGSRPRSGRGFSSRKGTSVIRKPGRAEAALQAVRIPERLLERMELGPAPGASPSTVVSSWPSACTASIRQERTGSPSSSTVQAPHTPCSQPTWVPVRPSSWRRKSESSRRGSTSRS